MKQITTLRMRAEDGKYRTFSTEDENIQHQLQEG